jgi:hypothetical protein
MKKILIISLLMVSLIISGCFIRPYPIYDLNPAGTYTTRWLFGCEYVILEEDGIIASLAYVNSEKNMLVFDLEVINLRAADVLVAPESFYYYPLISKSLADTLKVMAINPQLQLKKLDKIISQKRADLSNQIIGNIIVESADLIDDIVESDQRNMAEKQLDAQEDLKRQVNQERRESRTRNQIDNLTTSRKYWASEVLRKTTLKQDQSIQGRIYFPTEREIEKLEVILTIENSKFVFLFDQARF